MSLRPIARAVKEWSPAQGAPADPMTALGLVWPAVVGPGVAAQTRPLEVTGDALVIATRSSAWSQQLSFLQGDILAALHGIAGFEHVVRVRFRVGRVGGGRGRRSASAPRVAGRVRSEPAPADPAATAGEAMERFRARVAATRRTAASACPACGTPRAEATPCAPCAQEDQRLRRTAAQRLMYDAPWLGFGGTAPLVDGMTRDDYDRWRRALLSRWWETLNRMRWTKRTTPVERRIASSFVLLESGLDPDRITPAIVRTVLGDDVVALLEASRGAGPV
jgi:hypothetical protein